MLGNSAGATAVDYDRASMTRMFSTSVRIGSLSLVNDDVVEETKTY